MELNLEQLYDDTFYVEKCSWGTWKSYDKDRNALVTSLTQETCIAATRFYCKGLSGGFGESSKSYVGQIDGKL
jgi:hypothetical protein